MKKLLLGVAVAAATLLVATSAFAQAKNHFPPGPLGTCTDTMSIVVLKTYLNNTLDPCGALTPNTTGTAGDTVLGVGGIITAFDEIPTGFDIYIQQTGGGENTGLDVFTHGTNFRAPYGFNLGDSIVVEYACVANFNGDVEVLAPNGNFSGPNIVLRKVSSGNALPPFLHGNTTDFKETSNPFFLKHVSELVTLDGPVRVARIAGFTSASTNQSFIVVRDDAPSDSVYIGYNKLSTLTRPALGTYLTSISGVSNAQTRGLFIMPRDGNDIVDTQPPGVTDAYAIADNQYRVIFDRAVVSATATNTANYNLASFGSVDAAVMDGTNAVILTVTTGLPHGASETVSVNGITGVANGLTMTTPANPSFLAGVLSCGEMSAPDPDSLLKTPCQDKSRYAGALGDFTNGLGGPRSTFTGIVTGVFGNLYYMQDANSYDPYQFDGSHRGITVFAPPVALQKGHRYTIAGADEEFYKENEFAFITYVRDDGAASVQTPPVLPISLVSRDTCDAARNLMDGKDYLSLLVNLRNVTVVQRFNPLPTNGFHVAGPYPDNTDTMFVENQNTVLGANVATNYPAVGSLVNVVGLVHYTTNTSTPSVRVCPRSQADITLMSPPTGVGGSLPAKLAFAAFPNPSRNVNLAFALPKAAHVSLGVYDLLGRKVATIVNGNMSAGSYSRSWNGRDDSGNSVNSGVYFYRLNVDGQVRTARTMVINN
jgi:hypothetical protein